MKRLEAKFTSAFSRDVKKRVLKQRRDLKELEAVIDLILDNTQESTEALKRRHRMHRLSGEWDGSNECHVANAGDWLVIWKTVGGVAYFQPTGSHNDLFRK